MGGHQDRDGADDPALNKCFELLRHSRRLSATSGTCGSTGRVTSARVSKLNVQHLDLGFGLHADAFHGGGHEAEISRLQSHFGVVASKREPSMHDAEDLWQL